MIILHGREHGKANVTIKQDPTWEEIFANVKAAPGTEAEQRRHQELRKKAALTEEEEAELNDLFFTIYPQLRLASRQMFNNEKGTIMPAAVDPRDPELSHRKERTHMSDFNIRRQFQRIHHGLGSSPLLCFVAEGMSLLLWACATMVDIQTMEYMVEGIAGTIGGVQWGVIMQPYLLFTGQVAPVHSTAYLYAWIVETVQFIFALVLSVALIKLSTVSMKMARVFTIVGLFLIGLNAYATWQAASTANPLIQILVAIAIGGFAVIGLPLGVGLIEHGVEEMF